nr:MAG TPA: hypothetical protein [Caudoviricetes sp.]
MSVIRLQQGGRDINTGGLQKELYLLWRNK